MLTSMRRGAGGWIARIFMGILVLSFAVWGVADFLGANPDVPVAKVAGRTITGQQFSAEFRRELTRMQQQAGTDFDAARARQLGLDREVLRQMIVREVFDEHAAELGLTTPDAVVAESIRQDPSFKDSFGIFDRINFTRVLQDNGFTEAAFIERVRNEMTRRQLIAAIASGARPPQSMVEEVLLRYNEQRSIDLMLIPQSAGGKLAKPGRSEMEAYYKANPAQFTAPEMRKVSYLYVRPDDIAADITVSDEDLQHEYQARLAEFTVTAMRNLEQFVLDDRAKADEAMAKIKAGADFRAIAKKYSGLDTKDLQLIEITKADLTPESADAIMALKEREVGGPFKNPFGWQIVKITAARDERISSFAEVRERLLNETKLSRAGDSLVTLVNSLEDARAGGATLEEVAKDLGLKLQTIDAIDAAGNGADGKPLSGLPVEENFLDDIFALESGAESDLRETKDGGYFVVRVDELTPSAVRPIDDVMSAVETGWRAEQSKKALQALSDDILKQAQDGVPFKTIAAQKKLKLESAGPFGREFSSDAISPETIAKLFAVKSGETIAAPAPQGGFVVARVREITPPNLNAQTETIKELRKKLGESIGIDLMQQYQSVLEREYDVSINLDQLGKLLDEQ